MKRVWESERRTVECAAVRVPWPVSSDAVGLAADIRAKMCPDPTFGSVLPFEMNASELATRPVRCVTITRERGANVRAALSGSHTLTRSRRSSERAFALFHDLGVRDRVVVRLGASGDALRLFRDWRVRV